MPGLRGTRRHVDDTEARARGGHVDHVHALRRHGGGHVDALLVGLIIGTVLAIVQIVLIGTRSRDLHWQPFETKSPTRADLLVPHANGEHADGTPVVEITPPNRAGLSGRSPREIKGHPGCVNCGNPASVTAHAHKDQRIPFCNWCGRVARHGTYTRLQFPRPRE